MIKLSKESKITFFSLLLIPVFWICLNHLGYLDYLKVKSVDLRKQFRGEIPQDITAQSEDRILVEMNQTVPRIPKVAYVNFDASTLAMDGVGSGLGIELFFEIRQ